MSSLKSYFNSQNIKADWKIIEKAPSTLLIRSLAQSCPFNNEEKQMLLESKDINKLASILFFYFVMFLPVFRKSLLEKRYDWKLI